MTHQKTKQMNNHLYIIYSSNDWIKDCLLVPFFSGFSQRDSTAENICANNIRFTHSISISISIKISFTYLINVINSFRNFKGWTNRINLISFIVPLGFWLTVDWQVLKTTRSSLDYGHHGIWGKRDSVHGTHHLHLKYF